MDAKFEAIVEKLVREQGKDTLIDAKKSKAFLADCANNEFKKERHLLMIAIETGAGKAIANTNDLAICKKLQIRSLKDDRFIDEAAASEAIDLLAFVLRGDRSRSISATAAPTSQPQYTPPQPAPQSQYNPPPQQQSQYNYPQSAPQYPPIPTPLENEMLAYMNDKIYIERYKLVYQNNQGFMLSRRAANMFLFLVISIILVITIIALISAAERDSWLSYNYSSQYNYFRGGSSDKLRNEYQNKLRNEYQNKSRIKTNWAILLSVLQLLNVIRFFTRKKRIVCVRNCALFHLTGKNTRRFKSRALLYLMYDLKKHLLSRGYEVIDDSQVKIILQSKTLSNYCITIEKQNDRVCVYAS